MIVDLGQITGGGVYEAYQINWTLDVPARSLVTVKYSADIPDDAFGGDVYTAQALAAGLSAEAPVTVREAEPLLTVSKWVNNRTPAPGTTVKYTIEVSNDGSGDAYDVRVVDHLPAALDIYTRSISDGGDYDSYDDTIEWYVDVTCLRYRHPHLQGLCARLGRGRGYLREPGQRPRLGQRPVHPGGHRGRGAQDRLRR